MFLRWLIDLLEKVELGIIDPEYEPDFDDYEYRQITAEREGATGAVYGREKPDC